MKVTGLDEVDQNDKESILNQEVLDALKNFIGSDPFRNYLNEYVQNTLKNIERIGMAIAAQDNLRIRHLAHKLKGSSGNIGALKLAWNCVQLEAVTVEEDSSQELHKQFGKLEDVFNDTKHELESYIEKLSDSHSHVA